MLRVEAEYAYLECLQGLPVERDLRDLPPGSGSASEGHRAFRLTSCKTHAHRRTGRDLRPTALFTPLLGIWRASRVVARGCFEAMRIDQQIVSPAQESIQAWFLDRVDRGTPERSFCSPSVMRPIAGISRDHGSPQRFGDGVGRRQHMGSTAGPTATGRRPAQAGYVPGDARSRRCGALVRSPTGARP